MRHWREPWLTPKECESELHQHLAEHSMLRATLFYDKRKNGIRGRCLRSDLELLRLQKGDRLEPSAECPDIGAGFDSMQRFPVTLTFWRKRAQTWVLHRNPLFRGTGIGVRLFMVNSLHTINLGLLHRLGDLSTKPN